MSGAVARWRDQPIHEPRCCWHCGRQFTPRQDNQYFCCRNHNVMAWRAVKKLEGTYGYVGAERGGHGRQFARVAA